MTQRYNVTFRVTVPLTINDEDALTRTRTPEWRAQFEDNDEAETIDMLAEAIGLWCQSLNRLDGWTDLPVDAVTTGPVMVEREGYERMGDDDETAVVGEEEVTP